MLLRCGCKAKRAAGRTDYTFVFVYIPACMRYEVTSAQCARQRVAVVATVSDSVFGAGQGDGRAHQPVLLRLHRDA